MARSPAARSPSRSYSSPRHPASARAAAVTPRRSPAPAPASPPRSTFCVDGDAEDGGGALGAESSDDSTTVGSDDDAESLGNYLRSATPGKGTTALSLAPSP